MIPGENGNDPRAASRISSGMANTSILWDITAEIIGLILRGVKWSIVEVTILLVVVMVGFEGLYGFGVFGFYVAGNEGGEGDGED